MNITTRNDIEKQIVTRVVKDALAAGFTLSVDDGGDVLAIKNSSDEATILDALMNTDEDQLYFIKDGKIEGWAVFIYGNDGYDVICDNTPSIAVVLTGATELADKLEEQYGG